MSTATKRSLERPAITKRQKLVYQTMLRYQARHGRPPALEEIAAAVGVNSRTGVVYHVKVLVAKGYIKALEPGTNRRFVAIL